MDFFHQVGNLRSPRTSHQTSIMSFRKSCLIGQPFVSKSVSSDDPNYHETCWIHTVESIWPKLRFCWILVSTSERGRCHILLIAKYHNSSPNYKVSIRIHLIQAYCLFNFYFWVKYALFEVWVKFQEYYPWTFGTIVQFALHPECRAGPRGTARCGSPSRSCRSTSDAGYYVH